MPAAIITVPLCVNQAESSLKRTAAAGGDASGVFSLYLYYYGLQFTRASIATIAELGFPIAAVFVNAYFIPGNWAPGTFLGLFAGQWIGTLLLLFAMFMLSRVNAAEESVLAPV